PPVAYSQPSAPLAHASRSARWLCVCSGLGSVVPLARESGVISGERAGGMEKTASSGEWRPVIGDGRSAGDAERWWQRITRGRCVLGHAHAHLSLFDPARVRLVAPLVGLVLRAAPHVGAVVGNVDLLARLPVTPVRVDPHQPRRLP